MENTLSRITVAQQGAQLLSWRVGGKEQLYLSPLAASDGVNPIRGGVPVCFPQFNMRGNLPKHGFARILPWDLIASDPHTCFELVSSDQTRALWPFDFLMRLTFELASTSLRMSWTVRNTGKQTLPFTGALHTYLHVSALERIELHGLQGQLEWDSALDKSLSTSRVMGSEPLTFHSEFDRVYTAAPSTVPLRLVDGDRVIEISQSESLAHTVVWNPHAILCAKLPDMPADGYQQMLCVEAAQVLTPIFVSAGDTWTGWQQFNVQSLMS